MRRILFGLFLALCVVVQSSMAFAWEFSMKQENEIRYRYWGRLGNNDIFGRMDSDVYLGVNHLVTHPSPARDNFPTTSFGVLAGENRFGSDMNFNDMRATVYPKVVVNQAITLEGSVNLTSLGIHSAGRPYDTFGTPGEINSLYVPVGNRPAAIDVPNTIVTVQWWRMTFELPICTFILGYRPVPLGMGLWKGLCQRSSTAFALRMNYGPVSVLMGPYLGRTFTNWNQPSRNSGTTATYRKDDDRDYARGYHFDMFYRTGPLAIDVGHTGYNDDSSQVVDARTLATGVPGNLTPVVTPVPDRRVDETTLAIRYFNGRFFFSAEANYFYHWRSGLGSTEVRAGTRYQRTDADVRTSLYGVETGVILGPSKFTFSYVRSAGDDPSTRKDDEDTGRGTTGVNNCYIKYWGLLMYDMYGTGTSWNAAGRGQPVNLHHVGAKVDYAVASNLNVFVVNSWAWRDQPNAYVLGGNYSHTLARFSNDTIARQKGLAGFGTPVPGLQAVPDHASHIGWEVDFGLNWQLLENLTWNSVLAFWQPGTWWSYAYPNTAEIYRRNAGTVPQTPTDQAGATFDPGRKIDPMVAFESSLLVEF
ncbi:MAG: hypothetical protein AB1473_16050 [Thermodesulfobacteriota bacterium]